MVDDIPIEFFCETIEDQIGAMIERRERGTFKELVATEKTKSMSACDIPGTPSKKVVTPTNNEEQAKPLAENKV